jgi:hypothetical protein
MGIEKIVDAIAVTAELTGTTLSPAAVMVMAQDLMGYPEAAVMDALTRCRRELTGRLTLAGILERISDGRPGSEEAWAIALASADEAETVVWTEEIAQAYAVASPILEARDKVGARMAFREAYERIVRDAKAAGIQCVWVPSFGADPQRRALAIQAAIDAGRLSLDKARAYLPAPESGGLVAALITGDQRALLGYAQAEPFARRGIAMVREKLRECEEITRRAREERDALAAEERARFEASKARTMADIERMQAERSEGDAA